MGDPAARLRRRITENGPIPFAQFMRESLYGEGGYYRADPPRIGPKGDFVTGSTQSDLFGRATARLIQRLAAQRGGPIAFLESGFGTGAHLAAVRAAAPPDTLWLAHDRVARRTPEGVRRLASLDEIPDQSVDGVVFSYELFDALPVHRVVRERDGSLAELGVALVGEGTTGTTESPDEAVFCWKTIPLSDPRLAALVPREGPAGQVYDVSPEWSETYRALARKLRWGVMVSCDFGFRTDQLFNPRARFHGTLACYREHRVHRDPFVAVGRQDLAAHVHWDGLEKAGSELGLATWSLTPQALWLAACGVFEDLQQGSLERRVEAAQLLDPAGMGTDIRVLVQGRECRREGLFDLPLEPWVAAPRSS